MNRNRLCLAAPVVLAAMIAGCASSSNFIEVEENTALVPAGGIIEFGVNADGRVTEVEYHISKDALPAEVLAAAEKLFEGAVFADGEKEYDGGVLYYEVTMKKGSEEYEVMMTPSGKLHRMELEVYPSEVPTTVLAAADSAKPGGRRTKVEKILDGEKNLIEYHIKKTVSGIMYKIKIAADGEILSVLREVPAEIEVPVGW